MADPPVNLDRAQRLMAYALCLEAPRYDAETGDRLPPGDAAVAAAEALRFYAAWLMGGKL